jgi:glycosyltransferase involved in cell wall biosynthesis
MTQPLRLTILAGEFPYPPIHGGRADTWSRIQALVDRGVHVQLVCWYSELWGGKPMPEHVRVVQGMVDELIVLPISLGPLALLRRLAMLPWCPSHAASRAPTAAQWRDLLPRVRAFNPAGIWQDNLWGGVAAERLASALQLPRWVRSHNIEFRYMNSQRQLARGVSERLRLWLTCFGIERYELRILRTAQCVFDISVDDMAYWRERGVTRSQWLPPIVKVPPQSLAPHGFAASAVLPPRSALYVGNLHTPNNVQGLLWFIGQVWPLVRQLDPTAQVTIAGSNPHPDVEAAVAQAQGITLLANPAEVWPLYRQASVLINPILAGSGVNIKTIEMLQLACPIVSTGIGAGGLPPEVRQALCVADAPADFARALHQALQGQLSADPAVRAAARQRFLPSALDAVIIRLRQTSNAH